MSFAKHGSNNAVRHSQRLGFIIPGITLCVFVITALLGLSYSRQAVLEQNYNDVSQHLRDRLTFIQGAAEELLELDMRDSLQQLISSLAADNDLVSLHIVDPAGLVLASTRFADIGLPWSDLRSKVEGSLLQGVQTGGPLQIDFDPGSGVLKAYASICAGLESGVMRRKQCGFIDYRVSLAHHMQSTTFAINNLSAFFLIGMATVVLVILGLLQVLVARRTLRISSVLREFGDGDRSARLKVDRDDEIGDLCRSINRLLDKTVTDEKAIRDAHARLDSLFSNVTDCVIIINENGIIESANPATEQIFGYKSAALLGRNVSVLMPEPMRSEHDQYLSTYGETGVRKIIGIGREVNAMHISGRCFPVELNVGEMTVQGKRLFTGILRDISEQVAMKAEMDKAYEDLRSANASLQKQARTDKLTKLFNRGYFDLALANETLRATRNSLPLSLILMDVDYFKRFNDLYGHPEGDRCLQQVASVLREVFMRTGEVVARYGGEEFAIILPHSDTKNAISRSDRLLQAVWDKAIPHADSNVADRLTVSIGVVTWQPNSTRPMIPDIIVKAADMLLYEAKASGRNRVRHDLVAEESTGVNPLP